jgi:hypothetical protein
MDESHFIDFLENQPITEETQKMIEYFKNQIKFKNQTNHLTDKFNVVMSFIKFLKTICKLARPKIYGSFIRNILEKLFIYTAEIGYGDSINHDIDIQLYNTKHEFDDDIQSFNDFISLLKIVSNTTNFNFDFAGFSVVDVIESTLKQEDVVEQSGFIKNFMINIPHYNIFLTKNNIKIKIDILGYKIQDYTFDACQNEFNINSLSFNEEGILIRNLDEYNTDSYNMFEIIHSIMNRTAICNMPFDNLLINFTSNNRSEKINIINQIIWFLMNRMKILSLGYKEIYSDKYFFDYKIEREENCFFSGNSPPYITIKLKCEHYISLMGLAGIINVRSSEWTESLKCPLCRRDLEIFLVEKTPHKILIPEQPTRDLVKMDNYEIKCDLLSEENINYINYLIKHMRLPEQQTSNTSIQIGTNTFHTHHPPLTQVHTLVGRHTRELYTQLRRRPTDID